jgi:hypothetical protein
MIVIPLDSGFGSKIRHDQDNVIGELQIRARAVGTTGTGVWPSSRPIDGILSSVASAFASSR